MKNKIDKINMPLYSAVLKYNKNKCRYHVPGHKGAFKKYINSDFDITELSFSGNLFGSNDIISDAENLYAKCYGAKAVKFSTEGTTSNIIAFFHSIRDCKSIIIQKNSHKSIYNALKLFNIKPIIIECKKEDGLYLPISSDQIKEALKNNQNCLGAVITSPDYYGYTADIKAVKGILGDKLLIVDAAHGSHLPFINKGVYSFADVYFCSAHKNLPALTPAAFTVFNDLSLYQNFVKSLEIFHTSSPSYAVLASMDFAREYMQNYGAAKLQKLRVLSQNYKDILKKYGYKCRENDDFTKLIISHRDFSGASLAKHLENKGLFIELYDQKRVLAVFTAADSQKQYRKLYKSLKKISKYTPSPFADDFEEFKLDRAMPYLQAANSSKELIKFEDAAGRISAADCGIFPPSYPIVCCGEILTQSLCRYLIKNKERAFGVVNGGTFVVK